jgi:MFS family permease
VVRIARADAVWLATLCGLLLLVLLPYYAYSAMLLLIQQEWGMSSAEAGLVFGASQMGYVAAIAVLMPLTDRVRTSYVLIGSAVLSVLGNVLFPLLAHDVASGCLFRALGGAGVAGTYMPGLRMISERFASARRGGPVGLYVASFVLGGTVSFSGSAALLPIMGWRGAYLLQSLAGILAVLLAGSLLRNDRAGSKPAGVAPSDGSRWTQVLRNRPVMLMTAGYTGHMWELYGMRAWLAPFLAVIIGRMGNDLTAATSQAAFLSSVLLTLGAVATVLSGGVSDRLGRTATAGAILTISSLCSLTVGWLGAAPFLVVLLACIVYGCTVNPDSPVYSTGVTELAPQGRLGLAMTVQSVVGWTAGIVAPVAFGLVLDVAPGEMAWGLAFTALGLGAVLGVVAMVALRQAPESVMLAGGRR